MSLFKDRKSVYSLHQDNNLTNELQCKLADNDAVIDSLRLKIAQLEGVKLAMPDPYYIRDMDYNIIVWPDNIAKLTGYSWEEASKLKCYEIFRASVCPPNADCPTDGCIKTKNFLKDVAVVVYDKNGNAIDSLVSNAGIYDVNGQPLGAVEVVKDNTTFTKNMEEIQTLFKEMGEVAKSLNTLAYDLKASATHISQETAESLASATQVVASASRTNEKTNESGEHVTSILDGMTNVSRLMKTSTEKVAALKEKILSISELVKIVQEVAAKTNLLAMNASIEAAHAGEAGKGFKVVASNIKQLSRDSSNSADSIITNIDEIIKLVLDTNTSLKDTERTVVVNANNVDNLSSFTADVKVASAEMLEATVAIEQSSAKTSRLIEEQYSLINKISDTLIDVASKLDKGLNNILEITKRKDMG